MTGGIIRDFWATVRFAGATGAVQLQDGPVQSVTRLGAGSYRVVLQPGARMSALQSCPVVTCLVPAAAPVPRHAVASLDAAAPNDLSYLISTYDAAGAAADSDCQLIILRLLP